MLAFKLALRNLLGAGLRTWLNVIILSFSFIIIIWLKGLLEGWDRQAKNDMIKWEIGGGQFWQASYDPFDPFTLLDSHSTIPDVLSDSVTNGTLVPVLISQGTIYPNGRMQSVLFKGISPEQKVLALPTLKLKSDGTYIPAIIGSSMAESTQLKEGDYVTARWRDKNGTFDAAEIRIACIYQTNVPSVDVGQVWLPIDNVREMMLLPGEATILVANKEGWKTEKSDKWIFKDQKTLLIDIENIIKAKSFVGILIWAILLMMAMLAVFDTQVLSIFRRQKEIGTYVALGMTRGQVVQLFTIEGAMHSVLATLVAAAYGIPLLTFQAIRGISIPVESKDFGIAMAAKLYPVYSLTLITGTVIVVLIVTTIVSYWPSRKIGRLSPTEALRGRIQ
jgi:ABC-type lipoprotein release transport system permease subunit